MRFGLIILSECILSMSKNSISDIEDWLYSEVSGILASDIISRMQKIAPKIEEVSFSALSDLPDLMMRWMGPEGHEEPVVPGTERRYLPLSKPYLTRKRKKFTQRGISLAGRQAFYSYSGELYSGLENLSFSFSDFDNIVIVRGSLDGSHWFNVVQKNYSSLKSRLKKQIGKLKPTTSELVYKVEIDRKKIEKVLLRELGKKNFGKLTYNDVWRPFLTPSIKYLLRKEVSDKINNVLKEL